MIIAFETEKLRYICEDGAMATKELGMPASQALQQQLADLRAADSIDELLVGRPRTTGPNNEYLTIDVTSYLETVWVANCPRAGFSGDSELTPRR